MAEGRLRCVGSSLFLKKTYGVGYQLTIEKPSKNKSQGENDRNSDDDIKEIVTGAVKDASMLSNVGTELSFQLPLGASDKFVPMFRELDDRVSQGKITTYGVSITTLDEVFLLVARGDDHQREDFKSSHFSDKDIAQATRADNNDDDETVGSAKSKMDLQNEGLFGTHVKALVRKRAVYFKRDKKAWCCTTVVPSVFVLVGLLLLRFTSPGNRSLTPMPLDIVDFNTDVNEGPRNPIIFNSPGSTFTCNPGQCTAGDLTLSGLERTGEDYYFCGGPALDDTRSKCSIDDSEKYISQIVEAGAEPIPGNVANIAEVCQFVLCSYSLLYFSSVAHT